MLAVQFRMARAALDWGIVEFAERAGVSTNTLVRLERGEELKPSTLDHLRTVLEEAGIEFIAEGDDWFGVRVRRTEKLTS
ncbi:helix-turn-helix transcriptional regulator [Agrobacterium rhizogenes]|uniref:Helix-turn-helix domain protein n=1 Tax=Rhizobium rhizogenes TaxID=359 RepID=A0A7S4ZS60_RHIRH|nr:helix-turn-helix transcriptional regulator [Rhizobium rhizogenes]NTJ35906.1 helix-turn-helix transcriptional regulator [Rhizobium rhizogenes]QCL09987.1 helix-turn-helix domain protein [Rhizobium rhizogenes]